CFPAIFADVFAGGLVYRCPNPAPASAVMAHIANIILRSRMKSLRAYPIPNLASSNRERIRLNHDVSHSGSFHTSDLTRLRAEGFSGRPGQRVHQPHLPAVSRARPASQPAQV